jgi:hypothetical protein
MNAGIGGTRQKMQNAEDTGQRAGDRRDTSDESLGIREWRVPRLCLPFDSAQGEGGRDTTYPFNGVQGKL